MRTRIRLLCLLLIGSLCCAFFPAEAENAAASLNGLEIVEFPISSGINPEKPILTATVRYGDSLFEKPATAYNHPLAQASMALSFSNFRRKDLPTDRQGYGVREFLGRVGFTDLQYDQYDIATTSDTVASTIGCKETVIGGEKCTLLAVSVCGFGYQNEWLSNFTFSSGEQHEGFTSAADKVLSRILLYLYNHPTENRLKIWISGFSRAAAVSNLVGQKLSSGKILDVEDLYVYTFATPNTATAESPWPCPSIFNITGSFDLVPTIPPSEWGYRRYGTTLYLPAQEVVLDYTERRAAVEPIYKELTGIDYWNSPNANWLLQKFCQALYANITDASEYNQSMKNVISNIWMSDSLLATIRTLSDAMKKDERTNRLFRQIRADLSQTLSVFLYNYLYREELGESKHWGKGVPITGQIMHEHYPDVYYAWMMSQQDPEKLFIDIPGYRRISLPENLTCDGLLWGNFDQLSSSRPEQIAAMNMGEETLYTVPMCRDCVFILKAKDKIASTSFFVNEYRVGSLEARSDLLMCENLEKDDLAYLYLPSTDRTDDSVAIYTEKNDTNEGVIYTVLLDQNSEAAAATVEIIDSGWVASHTLDILVTTALLTLLGVVLVIVFVNTRVLGRKKYFRARRAFLTLLFIFFLAEQFMVNYDPWGKQWIAMLKGACSLCIVGICACALYRERGSFEWMVLIATVLFTIGDVGINFSMLFGIIFFALGHVLLLIAFGQKKKPGKKQILLILLLLAVILPVEYMIRAPFKNLLLPIMIYTVIVISMAVFSSQHSKGIMAGGILFAVSDLLLVVKIVTGTPPLLAFVSLFIYYLALALLSSAIYKQSRLKLLPQAPDQPETVMV